MKNAAIFPFTGAALPVMRHFSQLQQSYRITQAIAWRCLGLDGKDAASIYNHPPVGIPVTDIPDATDTAWDILLVDYCEAENPDSLMDRLGFFQECLDRGKQITFISNSLQSSGCIAELYRDHPEQVKMLTANSSVLCNYGNTELYHPLSAPVLMVGGLIDRSDTLEVIFALKERFLSKGKTVSCIVGSNLGLLVGAHSHRHIFENAALSEADKISRLNQLARDIIQVERPELIIVEAPDAVVKYNDIIPNGFGIRTYMTMQALDPDLFVCCLPWMLGFEAFLESVSEGIKSKYGFPITAVHLSNTLVDSAELLHKDVPLSVHTDMQVVADFMGNNANGVIPVYDVISQGADGLCQYVYDLLELEGNAV